MQCTIFQRSKKNRWCLKTVASRRPYSGVPLYFLMPCAEWQETKNASKNLINLCIIYRLFPIHARHHSCIAIQVRGITIRSGGPEKSLPARCIQQLSLYLTPNYSFSTDSKYPTHRRDPSIHSFYLQSRSLNCVFLQERERMIEDETVPSRCNISAASHTSV